VDELMEWEELERFDRSFSIALDDNAAQPARWVFSKVTWLGDGWFVTGLGMLAAVLLLLRKQWTFLFWWIVALAGGGVLNLVLKATFERDRPPLTATLDAGGWSFPSGHAVGATIAYGMLAYFLILMFPRYFRVIASFATLIIFLVGGSRLYLGAHYVSDVLAGYLVGFFWVALCAMGYQFVTGVPEPGSR
jgi:undecaprenyl-diphosphatase